jgi:uncharacterized protein YndB with AHSA1/START domain
MSIAPVVRSVTVKAAPARAFELFTTHAERWWSADHHIGKQPFAAIVMEPRPGGRWFERDADGVECDWGKVLAWQPPGRVVLAWQLNSQFAYDPDFVTEVELTFEAAEGGRTRVTLEHRDLERFGTDAAKQRALLDGGWPAIIAAFGVFADAQLQEETTQ